MSTRGGAKCFYSASFGIERRLGGAIDSYWAFHVKPVRLHGGRWLGPDKSWSQLKAGMLLDSVRRLHEHPVNSEPNDLIN